MGPTSPELEFPDGPLVTGDWLQDHLDRPGVRVLDVRGRHPSSPLPHAKRAEYLPGTFRARCSSIGSTTSSTRRPGAGAARRRRRVRRASVRAGHRRRGSRRHLRRLLRDLRRPGRVGVSLLRCRIERPRRRLAHVGGGEPAGQRCNRGDRAAAVHRAPAAALAAHTGGSRGGQGRGATFVDARPRHLFLGEPDVANTGHIPGSRCLPYQELVDGATGRGPRRPRSDGSRGTPGSTRTVPRGS